MSDLLKNPKFCAACNEPGCKLKCACKLVFYCGTECQGKDWPMHKKNCTVLLARKIREARREHGKDDLEVCQARLQAANALLGQGRYKDAERCFLEARRIAVEARLEGNEIVGEISYCLGDMYRNTSRYDESTTELQEGLRVFRSTKGKRSEEAGRVLSGIGNTLFRQGRHKEALARAIKGCHCAAWGSIVCCAALELAVQGEAQTAATVRPRRQTMQTFFLPLQLQ